MPADGRRGDGCNGGPGRCIYAHRMALGWPSFELSDDLRAHAAWLRRLAVSLVGVGSAQRGREGVLKPPTGSKMGRPRELADSR